jgi:hypothetical protein
MFTGRRYLGYWEESQQGQRLGKTTKPWSLLSFGWWVGHFNVESITRVV